MKNHLSISYPSLSFIITSFLLTISLISPQAVWAQQTTSSKALKFYEMGKKEEMGREFDKAIGYMNRAIDKDPDFVDAYYALGDYHFLYRRYEKSRDAYEKVIALQGGKSSKFLMAYIRLAPYYLSQGNYERAQELAQAFLSFNPSIRYRNQISEAEKVIETSAFAIEGMAKPLDFSPVVISGPLNEKDLNYYPAITANNQAMYFTARSRSEDEDIYLSLFKKGAWQQPEPLEELNSEFNEGTCTISADGRTMIFTACQARGSERNFVGSCDLFISEKVGDEWQSPRNLGNPVNTPSWESQPSLSADGRTLYFISNRKGGQGGKDIWLSRRQENGLWSTPENLGPSVNTSADETGPFIHANSLSLYFASNGYIGYGGFDLYKTERKGNTWSQPENLGYPINNHFDQFGLFVTADNESGYYSEDQRQGDLYTSKIVTFQVPASIKASTATNYISGYIYDANSKEKMEAQINLVDIATDSVVSSISSDPSSGEYLMVLPGGHEYALYVNRKGYLFKSYTFDYSKQLGQSLNKNIGLSPIEKGGKVSLNNIFFTLGSYELEAKSKTELDKIIGFLAQNNGMRIEVGGHTDDVGSKEDNQRLSEKRAQSVVDYLKNNGVPKEMLSAKGYGESEPLAANDSQANRALNRRIEFSILEINKE